MTDCDGPQGQTPSPAPLRCLWLAREIPFPSNTGDRIYSAQLAIALAQTNVALTYLGLGGDLAASTPQQSNICWVAVPGRRKSNWRALFSSLPLVSAAHATREARAALERQLLRTWDVIVLDHYGTAWALERVKTYAAAQRATTVLVHITHNHEERLSRDLFNATPWSLRKCVLYLNYRRIRHWERRLASEVNLVSTITEEDRLLLTAQSTRPNYIVLTPGYGGLKIAYRELTSNTPRHTLLVGSFQWE